MEMKKMVVGMRREEIELISRDLGQLQERAT